MTPDGDGLVSLGSANNRWKDAFFVHQTVGAIFETGLTTLGVGDLETGTVLVWTKNKLQVSSKKEDCRVIGISQRWKDQPIVLGADFVLITGKIEIGDFVVTSNKAGHGEKAQKKKWLFFNNDLRGKIIAQALEDANGESCLVRCMINKS